MSDLGKLEALITPPETWTATLTESGGGGAQTVTINTTDIAYWSSAPSGNDFATRLGSALTAASVLTGNNNSYAATVSAAVGGTGKLTIAVDAGTFTLAWVDTDFRDLCGFTGDLNPTAATFTSDNHVEALWLPQGAQVTMAGSGHKGKYETDAMELSSAAGHQTTLATYERRVLSITWEGVELKRVHVITGNDANEAYETFWKNAVLGKATWAYVGDKIRLHWDAGTDATFMTGKIGGGALKEILAEQLTDRHRGQWILSVDRFTECP